MIEKQKEDKLRLEEEADRVKHKAEKIDSYAKIVKEMHKPEISQKKKEELENLMKALDERSRPLRRPMSKVNLAVTDDESQGLAKHKHTKSVIDWKKFHNPMVPKPEPKKEGVIVDYLAIKRSKREDKIQELKDMGEKYRSPYYDWKALMDKAPDNVSYEEMMKEKARAIEQTALMKERYGKVRDDLYEENEANDMLIDALEAKLSILDRV